MVDCVGFVLTERLIREAACQIVFSVILIVLFLNFKISDVLMGLKPIFQINAKTEGSKHLDLCQRKI